MDETEFSLQVDLHKGQARQGPGGEDETRQALMLTGLFTTESSETTSSSLDRVVWKIADLGCGTGAGTLALARLIPELLQQQKPQSRQYMIDITAVDLSSQFLTVLEQRAQKQQQEKIGDNNKNDNNIAVEIHTKCGSMAADSLALLFPSQDESSLDMIWSEGAIYNIGFETGIKTWKPFLKASGILAVSEITWTTPASVRPKEIQEYWDKEYPEMTTAAVNMALLEQHGYAVVGYFVLPPHCWLQNYYRPLQEHFHDFVEGQRATLEKQATATVESYQEEIRMYETYKDYYSYGFYIARKV